MNQFSGEFYTFATIFVGSYPAVLSECTLKLKLAAIEDRRL
jgi:hypothetical protein